MREGGGTEVGKEEEEGRRNGGGGGGKIEKSVLRGAREECWAANQIFESKCGNTSGSGGGSSLSTECEQLRRRFLDSCRPSWARHFERRRGQKQALQRAIDQSSLSSSSSSSSSSS